MICVQLFPWPLRSSHGQHSLWQPDMAIPDPHSINLDLPSKMRRLSGTRGRNVDIQHAIYMVSSAVIADAFNARVHLDDGGSPVIVVKIGDRAQLGDVARYPDAMRAGNGVNVVDARFSVANGNLVGLRWGLSVSVYRHGERSCLMT